MNAAGRFPCIDLKIEFLRTLSSKLCLPKAEKETLGGAALLPQHKCHLEMGSATTFLPFQGIMLSFGVLGELCYDVGYGCVCPQVAWFASCLSSSEKSPAAARGSDRAFGVQFCLTSDSFWVTVGSPAACWYFLSVGY